jgi:hypothetical protein
LYVVEHGSHHVRRISSSGIITSVAGSGTGGPASAGFSGDNGLALAATLNNPSAVYVDTNGKMFIADYNNGRIRKVDTNNIITTFAGAGPFSPFNGENIPATSANIRPHDVKGDSLGNIYIADDDNCLVRIISGSGGIISTLFGNPGTCGFTAGISDRRSAIGHPNGFWLDSLSRVYFSDYNSIHRGIIISSPTSQPTGEPTRQPTEQPSNQPVLLPTGQPSRQPTTEPTSQPSCHPTSQPTRIPTKQPTTKPTSQPSDQPTGQPAHRPSSRPSRQPSSVPSNQPTRQPSTQPTSQPSCQPIAVPSTQPTTQPTTRPTILLSPVNIVSSNLYMQLMAGTSSAGFSGDSGPATSAQIQCYIPWVDSNGSIYVPDSGSRIRKVSSSGIITTFGGTGTSSTTGTGGPIGSVSFKIPYSIVGDTAGIALYISDERYVWKYVFSTGIVSVYASGVGYGFSGDNGPAVSAQLYEPNGLWLTTSDVLYVADRRNNRIRKISSTSIITTVVGSGAAGGPPGSFSGDGGLATSACLDGPSGVYMDTTGRLFIADVGNYRIRFVDTNNIITTFAGTGPSNSFSGENIPATTANMAPYDVKGDLFGNIYVADHGYNLVRRVDNRGIIVTIFGSAGASGFSSGISSRTSLLAGSLGIWIDSLSTVYFSDYNTIHRGILLSRTDYPNLFMENLAGTGDSGYNGDNGPATAAQIQAYRMFVDSNGNIYSPTGSYSGPNGERIRKISPSGTITTFGGTGTGNAISIVGDTSNTFLYICDQRYIWKYLFSDNSKAVIAGSTNGFNGETGPVGSIQLDDPQGLWLTPENILYIADHGNHRIRKVVSSIITTVAGSGPGGSGSSGFSGDNGPATSARFNFPDSVYVNSNGNMFITDSNNHRIRVIDTNNIVTTFAGTGMHSPFNGDYISATLANLYYAGDVKGDTLGNIYIADNAHYAVRVINGATGIITTLFGNPASSGFSNGISPRTASLNTISGLWIDSLSRVYFSDLSSIHRSITVSSPTSQPSGQPTRHPSQQPTVQPSNQPSCQPSGNPTRQPTLQPIGNPTGQPSSMPTRLPTSQPTLLPTCNPSQQPTTRPSSQPSMQPTNRPTNQPTGHPSGQPSCMPTSHPSSQPSRCPTGRPSNWPSSQPSSVPTTQPSDQPSGQPSSIPTSQPTFQPTGQPSGNPTCDPSSDPSVCPTGQPSRRPSSQPSSFPTSEPTNQPSVQPTEQPFLRPTSRPSGQPSSVPSNQPTVQPTGQPVFRPTSCPSKQPTAQPTSLPTEQPTAQPIPSPTCNPSQRPTTRPTSQPSMQPTNRPTNQPSDQPSGQPYCKPTSHPSSQPSHSPTGRPSELPSSQPSSVPTIQPSDQPSGQPSSIPTLQPNSQPSRGPTSRPTFQPTGQPSRSPTSQPVGVPTRQPISLPSCAPSSQPSVYPTTHPTLQPSEQPSTQPSSVPSGRPTELPSVVPSDQPSSRPSPCPTALPTREPSGQPSSLPSSSPTNKPTDGPSSAPSVIPSSRPSQRPTSRPTRQPSCQPSPVPSVPPSSLPTGQPSTVPSTLPTSLPSTQPTVHPSVLPISWPSTEPSSEPSCHPTVPPTSQPSVQPTGNPTGKPSLCPSSQPSSQPISIPSTVPISAPSVKPSNQPTGTPSSFPSDRPSTILASRPSGQPSGQPLPPPYSLPSSVPTHKQPVLWTTSPTDIPTERPSSDVVSNNPPTVLPSYFPTFDPSNQLISTIKPTIVPSTGPTVSPTKIPTVIPSRFPTELPTTRPNPKPTLSPTMTPTVIPSFPPTCPPSVKPTRIPSLLSSASPTHQPTVSPSLEPNKTYSPSLRLPTVTPTVSPTKTFSVFSRKSDSQNFRGSLFLLGRSFPSQSVTTSMRDIHLDGNDLPNHHNLIIFGRGENDNYNDIVIGSRESHGLYSEVNEQQQNSLFLDSESRSSTIIGDINSDGFDDLLIGYPQQSKCFIYLGTSKESITNLGVSFAIYGATPGDDFGWAAAGLGDYNQDGNDDFIVSAKGGGLVYVFFGKKPFYENDLSIEKMTRTDGFKIIGHQNTFNTGLAVSNAGDFNQDGFTDILISALSFDGEGILYLLFGNPHSSDDIDLNGFSTSMGFIFKEPPHSFSGLSMTGLGDFNHDGFDDIAIGSLPYQGGYSSQVTYVVFGRNHSFITSNNGYTLSLSEMNPRDKEGFKITGGGFLVSGVDDVNDDNIPDLMITNYPHWHTQQGNAYLIVYPGKNSVSSPPSYVPSSLPSSLPSQPPTARPSIPVISPTNLPSIDFFYDNNSNEPTITINDTNHNNSDNNNNTTNFPTFPPTSRKTFRPSLQKTSLPSTLKPSKTPSRSPTRITTSSSYPTTAVPSFRTRTLVPTIKSTSSFFRLPTQLTRSISSLSPSSQPFSRNSSTPTTDIEDKEFISIHIQQEGHYNNATSNKNILFLIETSGNVVITGSNEGKNIYKFLPSLQKTEIRITNFKSTTDQLDFLAFPQFLSVNDLPFTTNPLAIYPANNYQIIFDSLKTLPPTSGTNFLFTDPESEQSSSGYDFSDYTTSIELITVLIPVIVVFLCVVYVWGGVLDNEKKEDKLSEEHFQSNNDDDESDEEEQSENSPLAVIDIPLDKDNADKSASFESLSASHSSSASASLLFSLSSGASTLGSQWLSSNDDYQEFVPKIRKLALQDRPDLELGLGISSPVPLEDRSPNRNDDDHEDHLSSGNFQNFLDGLSDDEDSNQLIA